MILDFDQTEEKALEHFQGGDGIFFARMYQDAQNKILKGRLEPGASIGMHCHSTSSEIIFLLEGTGTVQTQAGEELLLAGQCHYCPKGQSHSLMNLSDRPIVFYAVVPVQ